MGEIIVPILMLIISAIFFISADKLPVMAGTPMTSGTFPKVLSVILGICAIVLIIVYFMKQKKYAEEEKARILDKNLFIVAALLVAYYISLNLLGYLISTAWLGIVLSFFFQKGKRHMLDTFVLPVLLTVGLYFAFRFMGVYLPTGRLISMIF